MEHGDKGGGVQPVRDDSPVARPFLPVSRRERLLCVLLVSIAIVACAYAVRAIPALADALTDDEVASAEAVDDAGGFSGSGGGRIEGQPDKVRGDDGREYYDIREIYSLGEESAAGGELPGDDGRLREVVAVRYGNEDGSGEGGALGLLAQVPIGNGRAVHEGSQSGEQLGELQTSYQVGQSYADDAKPKYSRGIVESMDSPGLSRIQVLERQELGRSDSLFGDINRTGRYSLGNRGADTHLAMWLGGVGVKTWCKLYTAFSRSAVGKKIAQKGMAPVIAMCLGIGGMSVADAELAAIAAEERAVYAEEAAMLSNLAIEADLSELAYATSSRVVYNAANGIEMTAPEVAAAVADDVAIAVQTGQLPTSANATWETALASLMEGCLPADLVPAFSKYGSDLLDYFNLENPDEAVELLPWADADGFAGSGGGDFTGTTPEFDSGINANTVIFTPSNYGSAQTVNNVAWVNQCIWTQANSPYNTYYTAYCYRSNGALVWTANYPIVNNPQPQYSAGDVSMTCGEAVKVYMYDDNDAAYQNNTESRTGGYDSNGSLFDSGVTSFFDNGGEVIGNDAQFGDNGQITDYGNADITKSLYDDDYSPTTWNQVLADAGLNAVNPSAEHPVADDEVQAGENQGQSAGEATGKPTPGEPGSTPTVPRVQMQLDTTMADLSGDIGSKFPFSIPFNVSTAVNMLVASPEAPHFTWVFALPTGNVEYEVDLAPYSPVAAVLRAMLNVALVFVVISILAKTAQIWGFFDKSAD